MIASSWVENTLFRFPFSETNFPSTSIFSSSCLGISLLFLHSGHVEINDLEIDEIKRSACVTEEIECGHYRLKTSIQDV